MNHRPHRFAIATALTALVLPPPDAGGVKILQAERVSSIEAKVPDAAPR